MRTEIRALLRAAMLLAAAAGAACSTGKALWREVGAGDDESPLAGAVERLGGMPFAMAYVRAGDQYEALVLLGSIDADAVQTWYGREGLAIQLQRGRLIYSRGLPLDIAESYAAAPAVDEERLYCGRGIELTVVPELYYSRLRDRHEFQAELRQNIGCSVEEIVTPAYAGETLRVEERYLLPPHPRPQRRTRWLHPQTGQLLRLEYAEHPAYPALTIVWLKAAAQ